VQQQGPRQSARNTRGATLYTTAPRLSSSLQRETMWCSVLPCGTVCCSAVQNHSINFERATMCCNVLQCWTHESTHTKTPQHTIAALIRTYAPTKPCHICQTIQCTLPQQRLKRKSGCGALQLWRPIEMYYNFEHPSFQRNRPQQPTPFPLHTRVWKFAGNHGDSAKSKESLSLTKMSEFCIFWARVPCMGWLWLVGSLKLQVSFAKEPYKRDYILQKKPVI